MTIARTILGWIFIAIMVVGVIYAALSPALQPIVFPEVQIPGFNQGTGVSDYYSLIKNSNVSQNVNYVELNATVKFGAISVVFSDNSDVAVEAKFDRGENTSALATSQATENHVLRVNMYGEAGVLNLTLGRSLQYNGSLNLRIGGITTQLDQNANISKLQTQIEYIGGIVVDVHSGASFEQLNLAVDLGGIVLNIDADHITKNATINMNTNIGGASIGVNVNTAQIGASLEGTVDIGGITINNNQFTGTSSNTQCSLKTTNYQSADKKIDIKTKIGLGGITLQPTTQTIPGFSV